jgi:adenylate kinase
MKLIFLGPPGAGKGTQAVRVSEKLNIPHISTGDILRKNIRENTELGVLAKGYIDKGQLVPDSLVIDIIKDRIKQDDCIGGFLLDGFPRTVPQAEALDEFVEIDAVVDIEVGDEILVKRISGRRVCPACGATFHINSYNSAQCICGADLIQRADDNEETVLNRLAVYHDQTQPLINYYEKAGKLKTVDGSVDVEVVFASIMSSL